MMSPSGRELAFDPLNETSVKQVIEDRLPIGAPASDSTVLAKSGTAVNTARRMDVAFSSFLDSGRTGNKRAGFPLTMFFLTLSKSILLTLHFINVSNPFSTLAL